MPLEGLRMLHTACLILKWDPEVGQHWLAAVACWLLGGVRHTHGPAAWEHLPPPRQMAGMLLLRQTA